MLQKDSIHIKPNCTTAEERSRTTYSESMFRWADGHLSEKISLKKRDIWSIFGAIVTMILALDKLNATVQKYKSTSAVKEIREKTKEKIKREKTLYDIKEGKNNVENANETSSEQNGAYLLTIQFFSKTVQCFFLNFYDHPF